MTTRPCILQLDSDSVVRFVGDLHLGDGANNDVFGAKDGLLTRFLTECQGSCDTVVLMGDVFDLPQAWRAGRVIRAHREVVKALTVLSCQMQLVVLRGNRDWSLDYTDLFPRAITTDRLEIGESVAWHGHQLDPRCRQGGDRIVASASFIHHLAERFFGLGLRFPLRDHDSWQNRAAHRLLLEYCRQLGWASTVERLLGFEERAGRREELIRCWSHSLRGDPCGLFSPACRLLSTGRYESMVCGHSHLPGVVEVSGRCYVNAGSWTFDAAQYAEWDGAAFRAQDYRSKESIDGRYYEWMRAGPDPGD